MYIYVTMEAYRQCICVIKTYHKNLSMGDFDGILSILTLRITRTWHLKQRRIC